MYNRLKLLITLLLLLSAGQVALAQTFSVEGTTSGNTTTFKIKRSGSNLPAQTVSYRTVSLSAIAGKHFTARSGEVSFAEGETDYKTVEITETLSANVEAQYHFQTKLYRTYRFEVLDQDGFNLAESDHEIDYGQIYQHTANYVNRSVTDLVYFDNSGNIHSDSGNKYLDVSYNSPDWIQVTDAGYGKQAERTISTNNLFHSSSELRNYLARDYNGYKMYATVYFTQKEEHDGYQYIQIYTGNAYDEGDDPNGGVDAPVNSLYKACFILSYSPSGSVMSDPHYQFFPHRYDYVDKAAEQAANITRYEFDYDNAHLYQQRFKSSSYISNTSGSLVLNTTTTSLNVRFDAGGGGTDHDQWDFKDLKVRLALVDATNPTLPSNSTSGIKVSAGPYYKGNTFYVSVPFSEIVTVSGTPTLTNNWGTLSYTSGSGSNVLTFMGIITNDIGSQLSVSGLSGSVTDLAGNPFSWPGNSQVTFPSSVVSSDPSYTITYDLAGGYLGTANPDSYTFGAAVIINQVPLKPGYSFAGWTGSNGSIPQVTVTIPAGEHGDKSYTATWTPVWGQGQDADGSYDSPYIITTTEGLDMLAKVVDGLDGYTPNNYNGTYFALGSDISYSTAGLGAQSSNFTQIGGYFNGSDKDFCGYFDGKGHTISGIRIYKDMVNLNRNKNVGLFGRVTEAAVYNVTISDARLTGYSYVGCIVGNCSGSEIRNCHVISSSVTYKSKNGGILLGRDYNSGLLANYYYNSTVTVTDTTNAVNIGVGGDSTTSSDQFGVTSVHAITLGENILASGAGFQIGNTQYYAAGGSVSLSYLNAPVGYHARYVYNDGSNHAVSGGRFTMPASDISVSATLVSAPETVATVQGTKDGISAWWGTFYDSAYNYTLGEGATAYTMGPDHRLYRLGDDGRTIPKGTAVVIMSTIPGVPITCTGTEAIDISLNGRKNILVGTDEVQTYSELCVMSLDTTGEVGFFRVMNVTVPAFKAGYVSPVNVGLQDYDKQNKQEW